MKLSSLIKRAELALERWGDLECHLSLDYHDEELYPLEDVFGDLEANIVTSIVLSAYQTRATLRQVK